MTLAPTRCGFVAILGAPNAGKSTLVNTLAGQKVSIVSRKVQTTRMRVRTVVMEGRTQIIFVDTPGIFAPRRRLDEAMVGAAWGASADADVALLLADAHASLRDPNGPAAQDTRGIIEGLRRQKRRAILALNKIDEVERGRLLPLAAEFNAMDVFERIFMISGETGDGLKEMREHLAHLMPEGPFVYPEDQAADIPMRVLAAEITRERLYDRLHEELPYASAVTTDQWTDFKDGSVRIDQTIFVEREGQKAITLGKGGATIKDIGAAARKEMEAVFARRVHLLLHVKVRENWGDDPQRYSEIGLDFPKR